ncbi:MAG: sulfotransferase, partial [Thermomicrobia bacterium]|nr:sulfotransferase [Thermomicrobia bacterium]
MPVCIAGMARSGTSMCTRMLNLCGLYLGEASDLLPPMPDNPDGFWENSRIVEINEELLSMLGGAWDCPPIFPLELDERFARVRAKADITLQMFADREPWGWKDPRNSLTLPFWRHYFPAMPVVICLRNPLEVAQSLYHRSWYSHELSMTLWYVYNQRLLRAIPREQRIITHYDTYFADAEAEMRRVLGFLALPVADKRIAESCSAVSRGLRHHRFTTQQMLDVGVTPAIFDLYTAMCIEAGVMSEELSSGSRHDPDNGTAHSWIARETDDAARDRLNWRFPPAENALLRAEEQPSLTQIGVGRLDRSAMDAILLREEVHTFQEELRDLRAVISDARDAYDKLQEGTRETEQHLRTLTEKHKQRGAYVETLEQRLLTLADEHEQRRTYLNVVERQLADRTEAYEQRCTENDRLAQSSAELADDHTQRGRYIETLEQQLAALMAAYQQRGEYIDALVQQEV